MTNHNPKSRLGTKNKHIKQTLIEENMWLTLENVRLKAELKGQTQLLKLLIKAGLNSPITSQHSEGESK